MLMKKCWRLLCILSLSFLVLACSEQFCSLNCHTPKNAAPVISLEMIKAFAKNDIILMPKGEYLKIVLPDDKFFLISSPTLKSDTQKNLISVVRLLQKYGHDATVKVVGYTDTVASAEENQKLSLARARAVLGYLWAQGLDAEHLYSLGLGQNDLVGDPNDVTANAANRRVEIIVHAHCTTCF